MIVPQQVIDAARGWLGVPFLHQGRSRSGVDCVGLFIAVCREVGLVPPNFDRNGYARIPSAQQLMEEVSAQCAPSLGFEVGGLLVLRFGRYPQHFALLTEKDTIIHSFMSVGKVVEVGFRAPWPKRTLSCWRLPGVTYE